MFRTNRVYALHTAITAFGALLGVAASVFASSHLAAHTAPLGSAAAPAAIVAPLAASPAPVALASGDDGRVGALEQRVAALESGPAKPSDLARGPAAEDVRAGGEAIHASWVKRFDDEHDDPAWAGGAARTLKDDLGKLTTAAGISNVEVTCRTSMCAASLEWPSFAAASKSARQLAAYPFALNCARELRAAPPDDPSAPYRATLYLDCEQLRAGAE